MAENTAKRVGRPKGSTSKKVSAGGVFITKLEKHTEGAQVTKDSSMGYIKNGLRNNYPQLLLNLYQNSPTHHAAINFEVACAVGQGCDYEAMKLDNTQVFPNYQYSYDTLLRYIALDYFLYGSYGIEIIKNKDDKTYSFYHIPYEKLRCSPYDEDGVITSWWISNDWDNISMNPPIEIEAINFRDYEKIKKGKPYIYVFQNYDPTVQYYQSPFYAAGIKAIESECEYLNYDLKSITNGFTPSGVLSLPEVETDNQRQEVIRNVTNLFQGSDGANSVMIRFKQSVDDTGVDYTPFTSSNGNVNLFDAANQRTINRILSSHNIPSASLCGLPDVGNSGFASDSQKLETSYQLYQNLTGNYHRQNIVKTLNDMLKLNGITVEIILKEIHFGDFGNENDKTSDTKSEDTTQDVSTDNIEEKVEE